MRPKYSPVVVLERPGLWDDQLKREISYSFIMRFENPCVCFMSSAVATLCRLVVTDTSIGGLQSESYCFMKAISNFKLVEHS